jgi:hypothetical protein
MYISDTLIVVIDGPKKRTNADNSHNNSNSNDISISCEKPPKSRLSKNVKRDATDLAIEEIRSQWQVIRKPCILKHITSEDLEGPVQKRPRINMDSLCLNNGEFTIQSVKGPLKKFIDKICESWNENYLIIVFEDFSLDQRKILQLVLNSRIESRDEYLFCFKIKWDSYAVNQNQSSGEKCPRNATTDFTNYLKAYRAVNSYFNLKDDDKS